MLDIFSTKPWLLEPSTFYNIKKDSSAQTILVSTMSPAFTAQPILDSNVLCVSSLSSLSYLSTPPLGQDMTQGQFLSGV